MSDLTRPIIGIENRTAQEVFDIMCNRFRATERALAERAGGVKHVAYFDDGQFHWMSGIAPRNCELYTLTTEPAAPEGGQEAVAWYIEWRFKPSGPDIKRAGGGSKVLWDQDASPEKAAAEVSRLEGIEKVDWVRCTPLYTRPAEKE